MSDDRLQTLRRAQERAERFRAWWERDGMREGVKELSEEYIKRIAALDPTDRDFADKARVLSIAAKVTEQVERQMLAVIGEGVAAAKEVDRIERDKALSPHRKRFF